MQGIRVALALWAAVCVAVAARAQDDEDAPGAAILEARITLALDGATVRKVVEAIAQDTGMQYMAVDEALDADRTVTLHVRDFPVEEVLDFLEEHLELDMDMGRLEETGVLLIVPREPRFAPQLDHAKALKMIRSHPTVAGLVKRRPDVVIELRWDAGDRRWEAELLLGEEEVGEVRLREFEGAKPRIVKVEIDRDLLAPIPVPGRRDNF